MSDRIRSMQIGVDEVLRLERELAKSKAAHNATRRRLKMQSALVLRLYEAAKALYRSCGDNYIEAQSALGKVLEEFEGTNNTKPSQRSSRRSSYGEGAQRW